jgi:sterol desaturase/sphingolipid hydroxylase (fatty acid hydroxylase superfamily)
VHTELIGRLGVLDRILVTPSNHRVHHGQNDYCIDKNYGGILILWDRSVRHLRGRARRREDRLRHPQAA